MANTYFTKTLGTATNRKKFTISIWFKLGNVESEQYLFSAGSSNDSSQIGLNGDGYISIFQSVSGTKVAEFKSDAFLRDPGAWYNLVVAYDTTLGTAADRQKVYLNGTQQTSYDTTNPPTDTEFTGFNNNVSHKLGTLYDTTSYFDGSMANLEFVDGQQYGPEYFGSTDSNTGIWTPSASSTISDYGTNGFKLKMDTTSPGADTSGKGNTFSLGGGTPTLLQGSPSNNWCTMNPLANSDAGSTFTNGNLTTEMPASRRTYNISTLGMPSNKGKWYAEVKMITPSQYTNIGISNLDPRGNDGLGSKLYEWGYSNGNQVLRNNNSTVSGWSGANYSTNDIVGIALDNDNQFLYFSVNGTYQNSGVPTSGSTGTGGAATSTVPPFYLFAGGDYHTGDSTTTVYSWNFGEGFFGTTAAGTNADGNGQGLFAYAVPSGYYALNTKNLEAFG